MKKRKHLGSLLTNQNPIHKEIRCKFKQEIHVVQTVLSFRLLCKKIRIYKTIILPVVLYSCEKWSLMLREERRIRVFQNRILRQIFGAKRDENGKWGMLHNGEFHSLYCSPNIVRVITSRILRYEGHVASMEEGRSAFENFSR
jgi:hypothetical protein